MVHLSRRLFLGGAAAVVACPSFTRAADTKMTAFDNPLVHQRADAQIFRHTDNNYYMTGSVPEYDRLILRRSPTLAGFATAQEVVVWRRPASGRMAGYIWAPELHFVDGHWYIYFAAGNGDDKFHIRTYVLKCDGSDPLTGKWQVLGMLETPWDTFTLDSTSFVHKGVRYLCWAQREPGIETNSNLYLAPLKTPTTLGRAPVRLTVPTLDWEISGFKVAEAPAMLARNGRLFLTYSASATDARYCLGLLTASADADIMDAKSWTKSQQPVFVTSPVTKVFGPGHNSFTVDEQGRDVLVYHGRDYEKIEGDPLFDPNRHTRVQRLYYRDDGTPDFGIPVGNGPLPDRLSPLDRKNDFLRIDGGRIIVGRGEIASTQFRLQPGKAGQDQMSIVPITAPDYRLVVSDDGTVTLGKDNGSADFIRRSTFIKQVGLGDKKEVSFASSAKPQNYLRHVDGTLKALPAKTAAEQATATFVLS